MVSTPSTYILAGSALVVAAASVAALRSRKRGETNSTAIVSRDVEVEDMDDYISEDDVCKIFDRLFIEMQGVLAQLSQQIQQIQMTGQMIPERELRRVLRTEFERTLQTRQYQVFEEFDIDEDCLEEATWEFLEQEDQYPKVKRAVERFQKLWENVSGESVVGKRPGQDGAEARTIGESKEELVPADKLIEAAETYFGALTNAMAELVAKFKKDGKDLNNPTVARDLQIEFASVANDAGESALEAMGISLANFQKSIEYHSSNPQVGRALAMLQMKQQQALMAMGLPNM